MAGEVKTFFEQHEKATVLTLCKGTLPDLVQRELEKAIANVLDVNTPWKKKREVTLKLVLTTDENRESIRVEAATGSKLAPFHGEAGVVYAAQQRGGAVVAVVFDVTQEQLPFEAPRVVADPMPERKPNSKAATA